MNHHHQANDLQRGQTISSGFLYFVQFKTVNTKQVEYVSDGQGLLMTNRHVLTVPHGSYRTRDKLSSCVV